MFFHSHLPFITHPHNNTYTLPHSVTAAILRQGCDVFGAVAANLMLLHNAARYTAGLCPLCSREPGLVKNTVGHFNNSIWLTTLPTCSGGHDPDASVRLASEEAPLCVSLS